MKLLECEAITRWLFGQVGFGQTAGARKSCAEGKGGWDFLSDLHGDLHQAGDLGNNEN